MSARPDAIRDRINLRQVEGFEGILCPWCGANGSELVFEDGQAIESPSLPQAPWADAALLSSRCRACGRVACEVEISVVASAPPGFVLLNDHHYEAAGHTLYLASRGQRAWQLVHRANVRGMSFASVLPSSAGGRLREIDVPWLDEHVFGPIAWRSGWASAVRLTDMMLPCLRRIAWP